MRQLSYRGGGSLAVEDVEAPALRAGDVRVRVHSTGLCKSDVYGVSGRNDRRDAVIGDGEILVMGHETSGVVCDLGSQVAGVELGAQVAVNPIAGCGECDACRAGSENLCPSRAVYGCTPAARGGYAETMAVPAANVHRLADGTPLEWGALVEPLAVGHHGACLAALRPTDSVLVQGGGIVGLGAALAARRIVGDRVLVIEPVPERRALAQRLGLRAEAPSGSPRRVDVVLECVARPETFRAAVDAVAPRGLVVLIGIFADEIPLPVSEVVGRETRIAGSYGYSQREFAAVTAWVGSGEVDLSPIVERRIGFDDVIGAFAAYADGSLDAVRTLLQPAS